MCPSDRRLRKMYPHRDQRSVNVRFRKMRSGAGFKGAVQRDGGTQEQGSIIESGTRNHITVQRVQSIVHRVPNMITAEN